MSDDLIKRSDAIETLGEEPYVWTDDDEFAQGKRSQWIDDVSAIKAVPSVDRPQGEWRGEYKMPDMPRYEWYRCSECNFLSHNVVNFCPNCGADMRGEAE